MDDDIFSTTMRLSIRTCSPNTKSTITTSRSWSRLLLFLALAGLVGTTRAEEPKANDDASSSFRPHILLVIVDDLGSNDLGRHGSGIHTPVMDHLAESGVFLDNYYVLPYCSPTRASLLSGRYPLHTGCHGVIHDWETQGLPLDEETLPQVLKKRSSSSSSSSSSNASAVADAMGIPYQTHAVGKWHVGHARWEQTPSFRGFDSFFGYYLGAQDYFTHYKHDEKYGETGYDLHYDQGPNCGLGCSKIVDERGNYSTHVYTRQATRIIDEYDSTKGPLFLYLAYQAVHFPDQVPASYVEPYQTKTEWSEMRKTYAGMLSCADESIGNVTAALRQKNLWKDTLVVVTTDNGGPTDVCAIQGSSNDPLRGGKCTLWQGGTVGDALLSGPALAKLGIQPQVYKNLFHVVDWLPTLAAMTQSKPSGKPLDGVSHFDALRQTPDDNTKPPPREELFVGYVVLPDAEKSTWYGPAIRWKHWKLIQGQSGGPDTPNNIPPGTSTPAQGGDPSSPYLLYNLNEDPTEQVNVVHDNPIVFQILRKKLQQYQASFVPLPRENPWNDTVCDFHGPVQTHKVGPTWLPWCKNSTEFVFYQ